MKLTEEQKAPFREMGRIGGKARAKRMSKAQRVAAGVRAATIRWARERERKALA
jgi:hypothetical protein